MGLMYIIELGGRAEFRSPASSMTYQIKVCQPKLAILEMANHF